MRKLSLIFAAGGILGAGVLGGVFGMRIGSAGMAPGTTRPVSGVGGAVEGTVEGSGGGGEDSATAGEGWARILRVVRERFPAVRQMSTGELAGWLADGSRGRPVILDVRERAEFEVSHLPGAVQIDPDASGEQMAAALETLGVKRGDAVVAYCSVGYRSSRCVKRLMEAGFTQAANLEGSIFKWANEGREVVRGDAVVREVHPYDETWGKLLQAERHPERGGTPTTMPAGEKGARR